LKFTESASKEICKIMVRDGLDPDHTAVRMGVKGGGCSGFTYTLDFDDRKRKFDLQFESQGVTIGLLVYPYCNTLRFKLQVKFSFPVIKIKCIGKP
jgi:iron-sulfur cluster assembly accessory protein